MEVFELRLNTRTARDAVRKKAKTVCPECGKDIHDPDCAYSGRGQS